MTKYKKIAIPATDTLSSEIFQRVAFSHGYMWTDGAVIKHPDALEWIVFDPNTKAIDTTDKRSLDSTYFLAGNVNELALALTTPPSITFTLVNTAKTFKAEVISGGVTFVSANSGRRLTVDREIVKLVADAIGYTHKSTAPMVEFEYPESARGGLPKLRYVRLTSLDDTYLKGYEVSHPNSNEVGEFKNFVRNRILDGGRIELVKFSL